MHSSDAHGFHRGEISPSTDRSHAQLSITIKARDEAGPVLRRVSRRLVVMRAVGFARDYALCCAIGLFAAGAWITLDLLLGLLR